MKKNAPEIEYTYQTYVDDVLSGRIITGKHIRLACERFEKFKQNPSYYFDEEDVKKKIRIVSKLKHFTGKHNGKPFILLPYQQWVIASIFGFKYKSTGLRVTKKVFLMLSRKQGKALPITTPIPTPTGFTPMGDLQEGDLVFDETGKPCHVTFKTPIMTDHQLYKIIFDDGDEITADADHQWAIEEKGEQKIMTTQDIFEVYKTPRRGKEEGHRSLYSIPLTKPVEYEEKDYILHPYILGLWLGDGSIGKPNFSVSLEDLKLYDFAKFMYGYYKVVEGHNCLTVSFAGDKHKDNSLLRHQLISVGVFYRKHIPSEYLQGSIEQRLALLQGLMDTDGYVSEKGQCEFVQKSVELSDDFAELLSSLGIKYHRSVKVSGGRSYNKFTFYTPKSFPCFCLFRKYNRLKESLSPRLGKKFIRYVSPVQTEPVQCIQVDSPSHLYLAGTRFTPTHNTALASAIGILCAVADGEGNAEVDILANSRQQAKIAFDMTANFCESVDSRGKLFKRYRDSVLIPQSKSKIQVLSTDTAGLDGYNCSCGIIDEFHAAKNWDLYNVLVSSQGMREQPLMIVITTAGFLLAPYPCYTMRQTCIDILEGTKTDDSQFAAIYELDPDDDWKEEENWIKAAPSLGQTVFPEYLKEQVQSAINNPALEVGVKTKNFNIFCQSRDVWIQDEIITSCFKNIDLKDFQDEEAWMGVDLSAVSDLTATSIMFPPNPDRKLYPDKYIFKSWLYLPNDTIQNSVNSDFYKLWKAQGFIISTPGNVVDYDFILKDQISIYDKLYIPGIGYDSWNATQWAINATNEGLPLFPFSQTIGNFNRPTKNFEMLVKQGKIIIDYNPAVRWCFECVEIKSDFNGNCKPTKTVGDETKKIDPVIAMIQALGTYLNKTTYSDGEVLTA